MGRITVSFLRPTEPMPAFARRPLANPWVPVHQDDAGVRAAQQPEKKKGLAKAMHIAFEDQLVQKVMPKLRGIDTRGKSRTECLDKIRGQLVAGLGGNAFNIVEDFDLACDLGYGQFIWQSANYLNVCDTEANGRHFTAQVSDDSEEPPALFQKDETDLAKRRKAWNAKTPEHRDELRTS